MRVEFGKTESGCPRFLFSLHKPYHSGERGKFWLIAGQLYAGYAGIMLCLGIMTVNLWFIKHRDSKPRLRTIFLGL